MLDSLARIFDPTGFLPRAQDQGWTDGLVALQVTADLLIWGASAAISALVLWHAWRRSWRRVLVLSGLFIALCGLTFAFEALTFTIPVYRFTGALKLLTAAAAWAAFFALIPLLPRALAATKPAGRGRDPENLRLLEAAVEGAGDAVMIGQIAPGVEPSVAYVNPAFERMTGYRAEEVLGKSPTILQGPDTDREAAGKIRAALEHGEPARVELVNYRKNGTPFWVELSIAPVSADGPGRCTHWVSIQRDVTERRAWEEKSREREAQLREAAKLEAVGRLAGGIAHDFNNLLTVIRGNAELLEEDLGPDSGPLRDIADAATRAAHLARQLLAFARRDHTRPEQFNLSAEVGGLLDLVRRVAGPGVAVRLDAATHPVPVRIDRGHLEQIVLTLARNGGEAMRGSGALTIATGVVDGDGRRFARLTVADTGVGMTDEVKAHIFEPAFTTKTRRATGLGLPSVFGIVASAGGRIAVDTAPGRGTTFTVDLPSLVEEAVPCPDPAGRAEAGEVGRVLLVDDEPAVRGVVRTMLTGRGYHVTDFGDPREALDAVRRGDAFDLIVTDVTMPGMSGVQLAEAVRPIHPDLPVVFLSGHPANVLAAKTVPISAFVPKPFTARDLLRAIEELCAAHVVAASLRG